VILKEACHTASIPPVKGEFLGIFLGQDPSVKELFNENSLGLYLSEAMLFDGSNLEVASAFGLWQ
jgi:hypothetical protein